tara:strand:+ start:11162 stop:11521 length:360 start_codon:yes stop_codon:yes gene_type:complete
MKFSLFVAALVALTLTACGKPHQANPESIEGYGTRTEEGTTVAEERAAEGENTGVADPSSFDVKNSGQGESHATDAELAATSKEEVEDEYSGKAVLPSHNLDGNGNPITDGKDPTKLNH